MAPVAYLYAPHVASDIEQAIEQGLQGYPLALEEKGRLVDVSWEAAALGLTADIPLAKARLAYPSLLVRPYRPEQVDRAVRRLWDALARIGSAVQPDEAQGVFVDAGDSLEPGQLADLIASSLPASCSIGVAATRLEAKAAALEQAERMPARIERCRHRPLVLVHRPDPPGAFLDGLPLRLFWVCPRTVREELALLGFRTVGEIARIADPQALISRFGAFGWQIWRWSRGRDPSPVLPAYPPPSLAYGRDLDGEAGALVLEGTQAPLQWVREWASRLALEMGRTGQLATTMGIRLILSPRPAGPGSCRQTLGEAIRLAEDRRQGPILADLAGALLLRVLEQARPWVEQGASLQRLELVASSLDRTQPRQARLDIPSAGKGSRQERMLRALRFVSQRAGSDAIRRASACSVPRREAMLALFEYGGEHA